MRRERTLVTIALLFGALLRLGGLSEPPLGADEATHAWRAAQAASDGEVVDDGVTNAFLTSAQAALFALAGPRTVLARLPAALCGLALLLVPLAVKDSLGAARVVMLVTVMALDPTLVRIAREGSGASAALLAAALVVAGLLRWRSAGRLDARRGRVRAVVTAGALGLLLTTGPDAWSLALLVGLAAMMLRPWTVCSPRWRDGAAALVASGLLAATAGLWAIPWAGGVSASLTAWLGHLVQPTSAAALSGLVRVEALTILLALAAVACRARVGPRLGVVLAVALSWGLFLATRTPGDVTALALVLAVAAADGLALLVERSARSRGPSLAAAATLALALALQLAFAARGPEAPRADLEPLASDLERIAILKGREAHELVVVVLGERDDPVLRWALRRARFVRHVESWSTAGRAFHPALVSPASEPPVVPPSGYVARTYGAFDLWVPID